MGVWLKLKVSSGEEWDRMGKKAKFSEVGHVLY